MSRTNELMDRLMELADPNAGDVAKQIAQVIRPRAEEAGAGTSDLVNSMRRGRPALEALFQEYLVGDQLAVILGPTEKTREQIDRVLNAPFPYRKAITVEFIDLLLARLQQLEALVRLLARTLVEMQYPSERAPADYVSASSASRRRAC